MPARRLRPVGSSMNSAVKIGELALEILAIFLPCHAVDTGRRIPLQPRVGAVKKLDIDMVEERGEPFLPIQPCSCPYNGPVQGTRSPGSESGACWLVPCSPRPPPFAPPTPAPVARR